VTRWVFAILGVVLLLPLGVQALVSWFSRYGGDDFCTASITLTQGFFGAQAYWFTQWSGRFTFTALVTAVEELGDWTPRVIPALTLVAWVAVGYWTVLGLARRLRWPYPRLSSLVIAEIIPFATLTAVPNIGQSFYWQTGVLTYLVPLILATFYVGWAMREVWSSETRPLRPTAVVMSGILALIAGGLSETSLTIQTAAFALAGAVGLLTLRGAQRRTLLYLVAAGLVGSLLAVGIMLLAPGTKVRAAQEADPAISLARLPVDIRASVDLAISIARRFEALSRTTFILTLLLPGLIGYLVARASSASASDQAGNHVGPAAVARPVWVAALGFGLLALSLFPVYLIQGFDPPARVQTIGEFVLIVTLAWVGYLLGGLIGQTFGTRLPPAVQAAAAVVAFGVVLIAPLSESRNTFRDLPYESTYAAAWDGVDRNLRAASLDPTDPVAVDPLPPRWGWAFVDTKPDQFPNRCVARLYGLPDVVATGPAPAWSGVPEAREQPPGA
jgi:hypothetical protein